MLTVGSTELRRVKIIWRTLWVTFWMLALGCFALIYFGHFVLGLVAALVETLLWLGWGEWRRKLEERYEVRLKRHPTG